MNYTDEQLNILIDTQLSEEIKEFENTLNLKLNESQIGKLKKRITIEVYLWYKK